MQCLNLKNEEVKAAVNEVTAVIGSEDAAYYIISENNGYAIDKSPDGRPSLQFSDLLSQCDGDRAKAIKQAVKLFRYKINHDNSKEEGGALAQYEYHDMHELTDTPINENIYGRVSSGKLMSNLAKYLPKDSIVKNILELLASTDVYTLIDSDGSMSEYMQYNLDTDTIIINALKFNINTIGYNAESFAHELIHAYTARTIGRIEEGTSTTTEKKLYDSLVRLHEHYKTYFLALESENGFQGKLYGLNNIYEFAAELLTNRSLVEILLDAPEVKVREGFINKLKLFIKDLVATLGLLTKTDLLKLLDDLLGLLTYNITNNVKEEDFVDSMRDLLFRKESAFNNVEDILKYTELDKEELDDLLHNINDVILHGMQSRKKVFNDPDPTVKAKVRALMDWQIANITQGLASDLENIVNFLNDMQDEVKKTHQLLVDSRKNNTLLDDTKLNDLDLNFFQFYCGAIDEIVSQLIYREPYREIVGKDKDGNYKLDRIIARAKTYLNLLTEGLSIIKIKMAENAAKILNDVGVEVGAIPIYNYSKFNTVTTDKDISGLTYWLGAGDKIKDESIKTIFYLINKAEEKTNHDVFAITLKFDKLLSRLSPESLLKLFELDDDGNTTGYLVRARNYGKLEKNYRKAMDEICLSLGLDMTQISLPENRSIRILYNKLRNEWVSKHTDRKFTKEYYDAFNHLSEEAQALRESIQVNIRSLHNKARDEYGIVKLDRLTKSERDSLSLYEIEKKQLSSIYDYKGRKKQGIQLLIAEELTELNLKLLSGFVMKKNSEAYEKEKASIMVDKSLSQQLKDEWVKLNSKVLFKEEFYKKLANLERKVYGAKYAELLERRRALLRMFRDDSTGETKVDLIPTGTKNALAAISKEMSRIRKVKKGTTVEGEETFEDIAEVVPIEQWYKDKIKYYDSVITENPESAELWLKENAYTIKEKLPNGKIKIRIQPKAWYTKMVPKDKSMIETVPNNNWLEVSSESKFYNKAYFESQQRYPELKNEYWIPKKQVKDENGKVVENYDTNGKRDAIFNDENLKNLYDAVVYTLKESNDELTNLNKTYPYRIPQKSGSLYRYMQAGWKRGRNIGRLTGSFKGFIEFIKDALSTRNDDVGFNTALTKPNGERLNLIPLNYIKKLEDPAIISADLIGSVIEYYKSCKNWKYKTEILPKVEILKNNVKGKKFRTGLNGEIKTGESNIYKFTKAFLDMNLYSIRNQNVTIQYGNNKSGKMFGLIPYKGNIFNMVHYDISKPRLINITKLLSILKVLGTYRNLALNFVCALTGGVTALYSHLINSLVQRYYNPVDAGYALGEMISDMVINMSNKTGINTYKPFMSRAMEFFNVGAEAMPNPTNRRAIVNIVSKHWGFGIYTLQDHFVKGQILGSVMHAFKLVEDSNGNKRFISREEYKKENNLDTYSPGDLMDWNFGDKPTFRDSVEFIEGRLVAKDSKNQKAVDEAIDKIGYIARSLAQSADGQLTDLLKSVILSHSMGLFLMMHRQYLPVILLERYTMSKLYDYLTLRWKEGVFRSPIRVITEAIQLNENIISAYKKAAKEDPIVRENTARIIYETAIWLLLSQIIRPLCSSSADDDKRNIIKLILAYTMERGVFETMAAYNVVDMARLIKSPSAITSYVETLFDLFQAPVGIIYQSTKAVVKGEEYRTKRIQRGAYKGWTEGERSAVKLTPFKNLVELKDIQSKRNYYKNLILGE